MLYDFYNNGKLFARAEMSPTEAEIYEKKFQIEARLAEQQN